MLGGISGDVLHSPTLQARALRMSTVVFTFKPTQPEPTQPEPTQPEPTQPEPTSPVTILVDPSQNRQKVLHFQIRRPCSSVSCNDLEQENAKVIGNQGSAAIELASHWAL